jgi:phosphatidylglycerol:prolipoprotein diacylglycerol transferase
MWPVEHLRLGTWHVTVSLYDVAILLGILTGLAIAVRRARRPETMLVVASLAVLAGVPASHLWHQTIHGSPGLSSMGGIGGGLVAIAVAARVLGVSLRETLDAIAPGALAGFAVGRIGCFLAGCCHGVPTALPWGVVLPELGPPARHPVQLYEAAANAAVAWSVARVRAPAGVPTGHAMIGYAVGRLLLEPLRDPGGTDVAGLGLSVVRWCAAVLVVAGGMLVLRGSRVTPPSPPGRGGGCVVSPPA